MHSWHWADLVFRARIAPASVKLVAIYLAHRTDHRTGLVRVREADVAAAAGISSRSARRALAALRRQRVLELVSSAVGRPGNGRLPTYRLSKLRLLELADSEAPLAPVVEDQKFGHGWPGFKAEDARELGHQGPKSGHGWPELQATHGRLSGIPALSVSAAPGAPVDNSGGDRPPVNSRTQDETAEPEDRAGKRRVRAAVAPLLKRANVTPHPALSVAVERTHRRVQRMK